LAGCSQYISRSRLIISTNPKLWEWNRGHPFSQIFSHKNSPRSSIKWCVLKLCKNFSAQAFYFYIINIFKIITVIIRYFWGYLHWIKTRNQGFFSSSWKEFSWLSHDLRKGDIWKIPGFLSYRINVLFSLSILIQTRKCWEIFNKGEVAKFIQIWRIWLFPKFSFFFFQIFSEYVSYDDNLRYIVGDKLMLLYCEDIWLLDKLIDINKINPKF